MFLAPEMIRSSWLTAWLIFQLQSKRRAQCRNSNRRRQEAGYFARWNASNPEKNKAKLERYRKNNPEKVKATQARYNRTEKSKLRLARYAARHPDKVKLKQHRYNVSEAGKASRKRWKSRNPEKMRQLWSNSQKRRYATNPQYRMMKHCRGRVQAAFKSQGEKMPASTSKLIGCSWPELKSHVESQFQPGMTWENRGSFHIDHIKPIARFDLTDPKQVLECFNFKNLQPLWGADNLRKSDRYEEVTV